MNIRRATLADVPRLAEMAARFVRESSYSKVVTPSEPAMEQSFAAIVSSPTGICFVAEEGGGVQGAILGLVTPHLMTGGNVAVEIGWWVEPEVRGATGLALLSAYEAAVQIAGVTLSVMTCPPDNSERVGRIYERAGYAKFETTYMKAL